jgi:hypothetical protein
MIYEKLEEPSYCNPAQDGDSRFLQKYEPAYQTTRRHIPMNSEVNAGRMSYLT